MSGEKRATEGIRMLEIHRRERGGQTAKGANFRRRLHSFGERGGTSRRSGQKEKEISLKDGGIQIGSNKYGMGRGEKVNMSRK